MQLSTECICFSASMNNLNSIFIFPAQPTCCGGRVVLNFHITIPFILQSLFPGWTQTHVSSLDYNTSIIPEEILQC